MKKFLFSSGKSDVLMLLKGKQVLKYLSILQEFWKDRVLDLHSYENLWGTNRSLVNKCIEMIILHILLMELRKGLSSQNSPVPVVLGYASVHIMSCVMKSHACIYLMCEL